ncbi:MAG: peptidoglycan recognition family protein [Candidatus Paceibacterota bacterium]|jgi:hypothetical protein
MSQFLRDKEVIDCIVVHHTAGADNLDKWAISEIDRKRIYNPNGVYDTGIIVDGQTYFGGYHYHIYQDGRSEHIVPDEYYTWNNGTYKNYTSVAISFIGNFEENEPSKESLKTAKKIIEEIKGRLNIKDVYLHRDLSNTACPGQYINLDKINGAKNMLSVQEVDECYIWSKHRHLHVKEITGGKDDSERNMYEHYKTMDKIQVLTELLNDPEAYRYIEEGRKVLGIAKEL